MTGEILFGVLIALCVNAAISYKLGQLAEEKGYDLWPYFWLCFLLGVAGYCMVAALPDQVLRRKLRELSAVPVQQTKAPPIVGGWTCSCGKINASYQSSCDCGKSKREVLNKN